MQIPQIALPELTENLPTPPELTEEQRRRIEAMNEGAAAMNTRVRELKEHIEYMTDHPHAFKSAEELLKAWRNLADARVMLYHAFWTHHRQRRLECAALYYDTYEGGIDTLTSATLDAIAAGREMEKAGYDPEQIAAAMTDHPETEAAQRAAAVYLFAKELAEVASQEQTGTERGKLEAVRDALGA